MPHCRLPQIYPEGKALFVTFHLHGSLPPHLAVPPAKFTAGEAFVWIDRHLDGGSWGNKYLMRPEIAGIVRDALLRGEDESHYKLESWVIMSNHVHILIWPQIPPPRLLQSLKGVTAREANIVLNRTGEPFWQKESYDHWVRDEQELKRIGAYIENNPVKAGLVSKAEEYEWSSAAGVETSLDAAR